MKPYMKVTSDFTKQFNDIVKRLKHDEVVVGIPEDTGSRDDGDVSNAALLAINNFGSPAMNIPARPVMQIGIRNAQKDIADQFKKAIVESLKKGLGSIDTYYSRVGIIASNSIKNVISTNDGIAGPSEATLVARKYLGFAGKKALIVTGQMRNAITYVVKGQK